MDINIYIYAYINRTAARGAGLAARCTHDLTSIYIYIYIIHIYILYIYIYIYMYIHTYTYT